MLAAVATVQFAFGQTDDYCKADMSEKQKARAVVQEVIQSSIDRRAHRGPNGEIVSYIDSPAPTHEEDAKIQAFGDTAVCALAEYAMDKPTIEHYGLQQWAALKLLASFKSDNALAAMVRFAKYSHPRSYAVTYMCAFPFEKTRSFMKKFAKDPDSDVREAAAQCLKSNSKP